MALFGRKKTEDTTVPPEVADYYQAENRERTWVAWLLAAGTLLVTVIVVLGLFYGGRWTYHKLHKPKTTPVAVQTQPATQSTPASPAPSPANPTPSTPNPPAPQTSSTNTATNPAATTNIAANSTANSTKLPNTGPGDTVGIFVAVSILAYVLHRRFTAE